MLASTTSTPRGHRAWRPALAPLAVIASLAVALLAAGTSGCGAVKSSAIRMVADQLSAGSSGFSSDNDPELIREALPFGLKTLESLAAELPKHRPLLRSLASGFTSYAVAFVLPEVRPLEAVDLDRAREQRVRARKLCLRGRDYGLRALEVAYPAIRRGLAADPARAVAAMKAADVPDLYWTAAGWGMAISTGKDQMDLVADVPVVEALIARAHALDEAWDDGSIHEFLIAFESRGESMGGSLDRARRHFTRAMELAKGRRISPLVSLAENVCIQTQNRKEFDTLIDQAIAFDVEQFPEIRLLNLLAQRKARQLKAMADDLFLEEGQ